MKRDSLGGSGTKRANKPPHSDTEDPYDRDEDTRTLMSGEKSTELGLNLNLEIGRRGTTLEAAKRKPATLADDLKSESSCPMHSDEDSSAKSDKQDKVD